MAKPVLATPGRLKRRKGYNLYPRSVIASGSNGRWLRPNASAASVGLPLAKRSRLTRAADRTCKSSPAGRHGRG